MLAIGSREIYLYRGAVDMRKSFNGLSSLVCSHFSSSLLSGSFFIFINRRRNLIKILYWDNDGLALWYKRLEKGTFRFSSDGKSQLSRREFAMLLEGVEAKRCLPRFSLEKI
jgi:transposase